MLNDFKQIKHMVHQKQPKRMVVVFPHDRQVIDAVMEAKKLGIISPILIGNESLIKSLIQNETVQILNQKDELEACKAAMEIINQGQADVLMKGLIDTKVLLKAVVNDVYGIKKETFLVPFQKW